MTGRLLLLALALLVASVPAAPADDDPVVEARTRWRALYDRAGVLIGEQKLDEAARVYESAADWAETHELLEEAAASHEMVIRCLPPTAYVRCRDATLRLLSVERRTAEPSDLADTLMDLGYLQTALGSPLEGLRALEEAASLLANDEALGAQGRARLAYALSSAGQLAAALSAGEQAASVFRREADAASLAEVLDVLAEVHLKAGNPDLALALLEEGLALPIDLRPSLRASYEFHRGDACLHAGRTERGLQHLDAARKAFEASDEPRGAAWALIRMGDVHRLQGDVNTAFPLYASAWMNSGIHSAPRALAQLRMGDACLERGQAGAAKALYELALSVGAEDLELESRAHRGLADVCLAGKDAGGALEHIRRALDSIDGMARGLAPLASVSARGSDARLFEAARRVAFLQEDGRAVFEILERTRAATLLEGLGGRSVVPAARPDADEARALRHARERLLVSQARLREAIDVGYLPDLRVARRAYQAAQVAYRHLLDRARHAPPTDALATGGRRIGLALAAKRLGPHDALVLYAFEGGRLRAFVVDPNRSRKVDVGEEAVVLATLEALRKAIVRRTDVVDPMTPDGERASAATMAARMRERLVDPLDLSAHVTRVLVCPHGSLATVPWGAVVPDRTVVLIPSATAYDVLRRASKESGEGILALGDVIPSAASRLGRLESSRTEVESITGPGDVRLLERKASESSFRETVGTRPRWRAAHFACHGLADRKRPAWSSLVLTPAGMDDGYLAVLEILGLRIPADVAVLSACQTGLGASVDGEGLLGLASAFLYAGSSRVVASLWKVEDEATCALMEKFHALHAPRDGSAPLRAAEALRQAQEHVRSHPDHLARWKHPYYWAGWVLWGLAD